MKGRRSPIDRMRELADDGLEPWQIAAALGVREDAVLVALAADEPAGGAQRAVEDASSLAPAKPDTLAPARPLRAALVEHVAALADHADGIAQDMTAALGLPEGFRLAFDTTPIAVEVEFDPDDASTYPCATGGDCGCVGTGLIGCPGRDEDRLDEARRARDEAADRVLDALAAANKPAPDVVDERASQPVEVVEVANGWTMPASLWGDVVARGDALVDELVDEEPAAAEPGALEVVEYSGVQTLPAALVAPAEPDPEHVHDPFPVVDETGVWHAECECGHRWDRSPCEYSGCTAYVAALHIARTGTSRHAHHPPA